MQSNLLICSKLQDSCLMSNKIQSLQPCGQQRESQIKWGFGELLEVIWHNPANEIELALKLDPNLKLDEVA